MLSDEERRMIYEGDDMEQKDTEQKDENKALNSIRKMDYYIVILLSILFLSVIGLYLLIGINTFKNYKTVSISQNSATLSKNPTPTVSNSGYKLELLDWHWVIDQDYAITEGEVRNISNETLADVAVKVVFYDSDQRFIRSEENLIAFNPISAGQTSLFRVKTIYNPVMTSAGIEFKFLSDGSIWTKSVSQTMDR
jgi:hypothetical protein